MELSNLNSRNLFLAELVNTSSKESLLLLIGDDFNIFRNTCEKNNDKFDDRCPFCLLLS